MPDRNSMLIRQLLTARQMAYAAAVARFSTAVAPWFGLPANRQRHRNWAVEQLLIETMEGMKLTYRNPNQDVRSLKKCIQAVA